MSSLMLYANANSETKAPVDFLFSDLKEYNDNYLTNYESEFIEDYDTSFCDGDKDQKIFNFLYPLERYGSHLAVWLDHLDIWENLKADERAKVFYMRYLEPENYSVSRVNTFKHDLDEADITNDISIIISLDPLKRII